MSHKGSCHCGQISFEVQGDFDVAMECNCSHCSRKGYLLWFVPRSHFTLLGSPQSLSTYTFNRHAIQHHFCGRCGCAPFGFGKQGDREMAAVNVRCLEGVDLTSIKRTFVDGRSF
ncbi:MAG TPA: GFA family protein [Steroidobacteraceae bacterium]|jgi:hypothetical protein|nr:GFA family protein [Steroidobacteraceae bacterium]